MEALKDTVPKVIFYHPAPLTTVISATWKKNGVAQAPNLVTTTTGEQTEVTLPYQNEEVDIDVVWTFSVNNSTNFTKSEKIDIVTPLLTIREVRAQITDIDEKEATDLEAAVRHIINAHTGQAFGLKEGVARIKGTGTRALALPAKLKRLNTINGAELSTNYDITGDGWYLSFYPWGIPPVRADYYGLHRARGGVIHNPNHVNIGEFGSWTYEVQGLWGWDDVPAAVREAAKLLINDYSCLDAAYRDRYLVSMTAADWRIQFASGAYLKTGNVRADQLLSDYVMKRGWAVL